MHLWANHARACSVVGDGVSLTCGHEPQSWFCSSDGEQAHISQYHTPWLLALLRIPYFAAYMANITATTASTTTTPRDLIPRPSADSLHQHHKYCMTLVHAARHASVQSHKPDCHYMDSVCPLQTPVCLDLPPSPPSSHVPAAQGRGSAEGWFIE
jgi:hypothetical protein